jgi:hypothetical protein
VKRKKKIKGKKIKGSIGQKMGKIVKKEKNMYVGDSISKLQIQVAT